MASYTQAPAFNTYQTNPYELPIQPIVQAIGARQNYWDVGASQFKNAYQNYLGLELGLKANQDKLDSYMQGVNDNLKKITSTDLSISDNVNSAMKIFDPITNDQDIKYDNALTKHVKAQIQLANSFKTKDGGKEYSDTNFSYMTKPYKDFINSNDPSKGKEFYENRRYYTPYYDKMNEIRDLEKLFKPDTTELTKPTTDKNGKLDRSGYLITEKNKSIVASQYRAYMNAHLSDKAKRQNHIDGVVAYGDNIGVLKDDYINHNQDKLNVYKIEIDELKGRKLAAEKSGKTTEADVYQTKIKEYESEVEKLTTTNAKLKIGDLEELMRDKDQIAGSLYSSNWMNTLAKASERKDVEIKYSPDMAALTFFKVENENMNKNADRELDWKLAEYDRNTRLMLKDTDDKKKDPNTEPAFSTANEDNNETFGQKQVNALVTDAEAMKADAGDALRKYLLSIGILDPNASKATNEAALTEYYLNNKTDHRFKEYYETRNLAEGKLAAANAIRDYVEEKVGPEYKKQKQELIDLPQKEIFVKEFGITLSKERLRKVLADEDPEIQISHPFVTGLKTPFPKQVTKITYKGQDHYISPNPNSPFSLLAEKHKILYENHKESRNKLYNQAWTRVEGLERFTQDPKDNDKLSSTQRVIYNKLAATGIKSTDIAITHRDKKGGIYFKVNTTDDNVSKTDINKIIEASNGQYKKQFEGGSYYLPNSEVGEFIKPKSFSDNRLEPIQTQVDWRAAASKNNDIFNTTNIKFNGRDFNFRVTVKNGLPLYEVIDIDSGASFIDNDRPFTTLEAASAVANGLSKLTPEQLQEVIRKQGRKPEYTIK